MTVSVVVKKAHSLYVNLRPELVRELGWKRGDRVVCVIVEGDMIVRRLRADEIADAMIGAVYSRRALAKKTPNAGPWSNLRTPPVGDDGA